METSEDRIRQYTKRLMMARMKLLMKNGFYGLLLMHVKMGMSTEHETAWVVNGEKFCFNPGFLDGITDAELEYVLMHLTFHLALKHLIRREGFDEISFDEAADIVANSNILESYSGDEEFITLSGYGGVQPHQTPLGNEGSKYTVEEVYQLIHVLKKEKGDPDTEDEEQGHSDGQGEDESSRDGDSADNDDGQDNAEQSEGCCQNKARNKKAGNGLGQSGDQTSFGTRNGWDYHAKEASDDPIADVEWAGKIEAVIDAVKGNKSWSGKAVGNVPALIERYLVEFKNPQIDWRTILDEFVQEEVVDYSFSPPDRRFDDSPFFLPDFNDTEFTVKKILFMIDTSGSMSDE